MNRREQRRIATGAGRSEVAAPKGSMRAIHACGALLSVLLVAPSADADLLSGYVAEDARAFPLAPQFPAQSQYRVQPTFIADAKLALEGIGEPIRCYFEPYVRYDGVDRNRTIFDPQAGKCGARGRKWSVSIGYDVEFWGVLEFVNPANVLNQRDITEDIVTKRRLGRPMAKATFDTGIGHFSLYGMTGFTPMTFPSEKGRLRPVVVIDNSATTYESPHGRWVPEAAFRYSNTVGAVMVGASYYFGYTNEPSFALALDRTTGVPFVAPSYSLVHQGGAELQATLGGLVLKSEGVVRHGTGGGDSTYAVGAGVEYDVGALLESGQNISILCEYDYDTRQRDLVLPFTNDLLGGVRLALNDVRSTEFVVWSNLAFPDARTEIVAADASARVLEGLKATIAYRGVLSARGPFADVSKDSYVSLRLSSYF
jgi:hypothetical protein